jgi:RNA polymerase sigma-70 factor, ECF subfamily
VAENEDEDGDIRAALRRRDFDCAFRRLRERHGQGIYRACYGVLGQDDLAYEAMQDTFEKMLRKHRLLAGADSIKAYALQMAKNTARDMLRKAVRRRDLDREHQHVEPEVAVTPDQAPSVEAAVNEALQECLDEIDPVTRKALLLHQDDMPWQDIARTVGVPADTIRMRVSRVLKILEKCLERKGFKP